MGNCIKLFPLNKKNLNSYEELDEKTIENNVECIICFYNLERKDISPSCMINNCTLNAHKKCIKEWHKRKNCCPICNEDWVNPPKRPLSISKYF